MQRTDTPRTDPGSGSRRRFLRSGAALAAMGSIGLPALVRAQQGDGYVTLERPVATRDPDRVEVLEFFWFGCPHCYAFEPTIDDWAASRPEYVDFVREAPPLNPGWEAHSRAFYAAETLGITEGMFDATFHAIHQDREPLRKPAALAKHVESLDLGVDAGTFEKAMKSFSVETALRRSVGLARGANVTGVPSILINGKYLTGNSLAGGHRGVVSVIDRLTAKEHAAS